jgi:hypothetical protein
VGLSATVPIQPFVAFIATLPRPVMLWMAILGVATLAKNASKRNRLPARKLQDSGECPWPFIFFHEPVYGLRKYARLNAACMAIWAFKHRSWLLRRLTPFG